MITNYSVFLTIMITNQLKKSNYTKKDKEEILQKKNNNLENKTVISKCQNGPMVPHITVKKHKMRNLSSEKPKLLGIKKQFKQKFSGKS